MRVIARPQLRVVFESSTAVTEDRDRRGCCTASARVLGPNVHKQSMGLDQYHVLCEHVRSRRWMSAKPRPGAPGVTREMIPFHSYRCGGEGLCVNAPIQPGIHRDALIRRPPLSPSFFLRVSEALSPLHSISTSKIKVDPRSRWAQKEQTPRGWILPRSSLWTPSMP
jgi:hypothetical protein